MKKVIFSVPYPDEGKAHERLKWVILRFTKPILIVQKDLTILVLLWKFLFAGKFCLVVLTLCIHWKKISSNQLFRNFFSKNVSLTFTKFSK